MYLTGHSLDGRVGAPTRGCKFPPSRKLTHTHTHTPTKPEGIKRAFNEKCFILGEGATEVQVSAGSLYF